ncbi:hypothetical protein RM843_001016 [Salmonella enterica]|nr:hypothetical protein [Salmonella enterica subsp. enterica]ELD2879698.1 hypothetical protein [Salmonella enterica]ELE9876379.1 hypothetical protein [Salmonella enterica]
MISNVPDVWVTNTTKVPWLKTKNLLNALDEIIIELKNNGKKQSANFSLLRYENIKNLNNHLESIKELSTCRAMAQYANFSIAEEN